MYDTNDEGFDEMVSSIDVALDQAFGMISNDFIKTRSYYYLSAGLQEDAHHEAVLVVGRTKKLDAFMHILLVDLGDRLLVMDAAGTAYPSEKPGFSVMIGGMTLQSLRAPSGTRLKRKTSNTTRFDSTSQP